jgi:hypothetical protein
MAPRAATKKTEAELADLLSVEIELPTANGGTESRILRFKSWNEIPIGILRRHRNDFTAQLYAALEWSLPASELAVFDELPASKLLEVRAKMQEASNADLGESPASST